MTPILCHVQFYPGVFTTENWCASAVGHENVHGGQDASWWTRRWFNAKKFYKMIEYPAYQWEVDNAEKNGLSPSELEIVEKKRDQAKQGMNPIDD